jgi:hypothetical protein
MRIKRKRALTQEAAEAGRRSREEPVGVAIGANGGAEAAAAEDAYWREHYSAAPYVETGRDYTYYQPAYRFGWESYSRYGRRSFDEIDEQLMREWDTRRGQSLQTWREARDAARDAWARVASSGAARSSQGRRLPKKGTRVPSGSR